MSAERCSSCGGDQFEERRTEYLCSHDRRYLLVPDAPVLVCLTCGMVYYEAAVLKTIERRFFAIQDNVEEPDRYIEMPEAMYRQ